MRDRRGQVVYVGQGRVPPLPGAQLLRRRRRRRSPLHPAARRPARRHRRGGHPLREGGGPPRERAHQEAQAALQRAAAGRQGLHRPPARPAPPVPAHRGGPGPAAQGGRGALVRAVLQRQLHPGDAPGGEPLVPAAHLHRSRLRPPEAALHPLPDPPLPGALRLRLPAGGVRAERGRRGGLPGGEGRGADRAAPGPHARGRRGDALRGRGPGTRPAPRRGAQPGDAAGPHGRPGRPGRGGHPPRGARPGHPGPLHPRRQAPRLPGPPVLRPGVPGGRAPLVLPLPPLRAGRAARRGAAPHRAGQRRGPGRGPLRAARAQGALPPPPARAPRPTCSTWPTATPSSRSGAGARRA